MHTDGAPCRSSKPFADAFARSPVLIRLSHHVLLSPLEGNSGCSSKQCSVLTHSPLASQPSSFSTIFPLGGSSFCEVIMYSTTHLTLCLGFSQCMCCRRALRATGNRAVQPLCSGPVLPPLSRAPGAPSARRDCSFPAPPAARLRAACCLLYLFIRPSQAQRCL